MRSMDGIGHGFNSLQSMESAISKNTVKFKISNLGQLNTITVSQVKRGIKNILYSKNNTTFYVQNYLGFVIQVIHDARFT